eukprot:TRINITY_DN1456_c0_g1_i2.p1 TRINITY_DN1456_c0_g1~~TRINITY_DN1456_c0_g1_i2.p1  ORF type:complete len:517 (+),score=97.44 TRINITY_DN1456_c0_g1_i2:113-1663(+)
MLLLSIPFVHGTSTRGLLAASRGGRLLLCSSSSSSSVTKGIDDMPGPYVFPLIGNLPQMIRDNIVLREGLNRSLVQMKEYGTLWKFKIGSFYMVCVFDPNDYEKVFRAEGRNPHSSVLFLWPFIEYTKQIGYGDSNLLGLQGDAWRKIRIPMQQEILSVSASRSYANILAPIVEEAVSKLPTFRNDLEDFSSRITFEMISTVLFNRRIGSLNVTKEGAQTQAEKFISNTMDAMKYCSRMVRMPMKPFARLIYWNRFKSCMDVIYEEGEKYVALLENDLTMDSGSDDFKRSAASYAGKNLLSGNLTSEQIRSNLVTFLFAGVDTTASAMRWLLINLAQNPEVQEKLYQEFSSKLNGKTIDTDDLEKLEFPYFRATFKESLRMTPTAGGISRLSEKDIVLQDYHIPKGTLFQYVPFPVLHDRTRLEDPHKFVPERWLSKPSGSRNDGVYSIFAHVNFGFGPRSCLGAKLASIELLLFFSRLVQDFKVELDPPGQKWNYRSTLTNNPYPMPKLKFIARQ